MAAVRLILTLTLILALALAALATAETVAVEAATVAATTRAATDEGVEAANHLPATPQGARASTASAAAKAASRQPATLQLPPTRARASMNGYHSAAHPPRGNLATTSDSMTSLLLKGSPYQRPLSHQPKRPTDAAAASSSS